MHKHDRETVAGEPIPDGRPVDLELPELHTISVTAVVAGPRRSRRLRRAGRTVRSTRYRPGMAERKRTDDRDVIAQLADKGEDALRRLVDLPRRIAAGAVHGVEERLHDVAARLRAIDPLDGRVAAIEKRLDSLEKPVSANARRASTRAKRSTTRTRTAVATNPGQAEHDVGRSVDAGGDAEVVPERDEANPSEVGTRAE